MNERKNAEDSDNIYVRCFLNSFIPHPLTTPPPCFLLRYQKLHCNIARENSVAALRFS